MCSLQASQHLQFVTLCSCGSCLICCAALLLHAHQVDSCPAGICTCRGDLAARRAEKQDGVTQLLVLFCHRIITRFCWRVNPAV